VAPLPDWAPLADFAVPAPAAPATADVVALATGTDYRAAGWSPAALARLLSHLATRGAAELASLDDAALLAAWAATTDAFLDRRSPERLSLDPALVELTGLSPAGLDAGLEAVLGGVRLDHARALFARAAGMERSTSPALAVLAGNLPGLAVQPLLPALALRRPLLLKSSSAEPLFAATFVTALARRLPALGEGIAAAAWPGGDARLEAPVLAAAGRVLAYGDRAAVASLACRAPGKVVDYGPKLSIGVLGGADLGEVARGLARDVALFEQAGCLSVQAVFVAGAERARPFAERLAAALAELAVELPPGRVAPEQAALVQQLRGEAEMRGALTGSLPLAEGTVILEPEAAPLAPSPGLRTVRVYASATLAEIPDRLAGWSGLLQGAALAGADAWELAPALAALGVSRCAPPGELQSPDASWHNGGHDPLVALGARPTG
jgi:hypothetical protein